ncbi:immunoglobulin-like domain-containing protein [Cohnella hashimotonis]|uniref:S-layer homology domain-containing protein n=1 Tax=Cohnella hashimotonis TaxID=2826895 RepID=A0ABT6TCP1_9BACL|nr:immunoglobulin-like domain-containing protein [Cohnella hashimotonis]MDI4643719.1 S-layer homology domain-containing protein [Cohnella hashimotonis]
MRMRLIKTAAAAIAVAVAVSGLAPGWALAAGRPQLSDDVLRISVNEQNGRIGVGTTGGDPVRAGDEDQPLVYNPETPETSFTSFRIDGEEAIYGHDYGPASAPYGYFVQVPAVEGDRIVSVWRYRGVDIRQTVELVPQTDKTLPAGNAKLSYRVDNKSGKSVKLGTRILLDVTAGDNDGPLLMAPGELSPVIGEREFGPADVPLYWQAMDDIDDPSVIAYGTLYGFGEKKPSRVIFGHWNGLSATKWKYDWSQWTDYTADGGLYGTADSAVAVYWDEAALAGGASASFSTLIGMGEMKQRQTLLDNMAVTVSAPQKVTAEAGGQASFELSAELANNLPKSVAQSDVRVEIVYPGSAALTGGSQSVTYVPEVAKGERLSFRWRFVATGADAVNVYAFKVRITVGDPAAPGVKMREETAHIVVLNDFRQPPDIQFTAVAPNRMYEKETFRKAVIYGSNLNFLKDAPDRWHVYIQAASGVRTNIESKYVTVDSDSQLSVMLPQLQLGSYGIGVEHDLSKGMYRPDTIRITDDISVMKRGYGTLLITKKDLLKTRTDIGGQYTQRTNKIYYAKGGALPPVPAGEEEVLRIQGNIQDMGDGTYSVVPQPSQAVTLGNVLKLTVSEFEADMPGEIVVKPVTYEYEDNGLVYDRATQAVVSGNDQSRIYLKQLTNLPNSPLIWKKAFTFNVNDMKIKNPNVFGFSDDAQAIVGPYVLGIKQVKVVYDPDAKKYAAEFKGSLDILSIMKTLYRFFGASDNAALSKLLYAEVAVDQFRVYEDGQIKFALEAGVGLPQMKIGPFVTMDSLKPSQTGGVEGRLRIDSIQNLYSIYAKLSLPNLESVPTGSGGSFNRSSRIQGKFGIFTVPTPEGGVVVFPDEFMAEYADNAGFINIPNIPLTINQLGGEIKGLHTIRDSIAKGIYPDFGGSFWFGVTDTVSPVLLGKRALSASNVKLSIGAREASLSGTANLYFFPIADMTGKIMFYPVSGALVGGRISLLDVLVGQASVELSYNNESSQFYFGGYVRGSVQLPPYSPIFPGLKLADASAALNTNFVQAYAKALGTIPVGVRYTWSTQQLQFFNPDQKGFSAVSALSALSAEGEADPERLAIGTNLKQLPVKKASGAVRSLAAKTVTTFESAGGEALLVQAKYARGSDIELTLADPDGVEMPLVEDGDGANVYRSEYTDPDTGAVQSYIAITVPAERSKAGTWTLTSSMPATFEAFDAAPTPEIGTIRAEQDGGQAAIDLALTRKPADGRTKVDLYLQSVDAATPFLSRIAADETLADEEATIRPALPDGIASGSYKIVAVLKQYDAGGALLQNSFRDSAPFAVANPKVPTAPDNVTAKAIGRGALKVEWDASAGDHVAGYYIFTVDGEGKPADGSNWTFVPYEEGTDRYAAEIRGWSPETYRIVVQAVSEAPGGTADDPYAGYPAADWAFVDDPLKLGQYTAAWAPIAGISEYVVRLTAANGESYAIPYYGEPNAGDESNGDYYQTTLYGLPAGRSFNVTVNGMIERDPGAKEVQAVDAGAGKKRISWDKVEADGVRSYTIYGKPADDKAPVVLFEYPVPSSGQPERYADIEVDGFAAGADYDISVIANVAEERPARYFGAWSSPVELKLPVPDPPVFDLRVQPADPAGGVVRMDRDADGLPYFRSSTGDVTLGFTSDEAVRTEVRVNPSMYDPSAEPDVYKGAAWTTNVVLKEGTNEIEVVVYDDDGDAEEKTYRVVVKENGPMLAVDDPAFPDGQVELTGQTDIGAAVTVNGYPAEVDDAGRFTYRLPLPEEQAFDVEIVASDAFGQNNAYVQRIVNPQVGRIEKVVIGMQREMSSASSQSLRLYAYDGDGHAVRLPNDEVEWSVLSGEQYAEIAGSELKGLRQGQAVVSASYRVNEQYAWTDYGVFDIDQRSLVAMTDLDAVTADLGTLAVGYAVDEGPTGVTKSVALPAASANGTTIEWSSDDPQVIDAETGKVSRPTFEAGDAAVTLTATVSKGIVKQTKTFLVNVLKLPEPGGHMTDLQAVMADLGALAVGYAEGDGPTGTTKNVSLPTASANGTTIVWSSDAPQIIDAATGQVNRPAFEAGDAAVTLTATVTKGVVEQTKTFLVNVLKLAEAGGNNGGEMTDQEAVTADLGSLAIVYAGGDGPASVTKDIVLPTASANGTTIVWSSDKPQVVEAATGKVNRPAFEAGDAAVTLTATVTKGIVEQTRTFSVKVLKLAESGGNNGGQMTDLEAVTADLGSLGILYAGGDGPAGVTKDVVLPTASANGTTIVWSSDKPQVIGAATGKVTRPAFEAGDVSVTLTATVTKGAVKKTKAFVVNVLKLAETGGNNGGEMTDLEAVTADLGSLVVGYAGGDGPDGATKNVVLPSAGANGTTIVWSSDKPQIVDAATGKVSRPAFEAGDAAVTLTATVAKGAVKKTKTFVVNVLKLAASGGNNGGTGQPAQPAEEAGWRIDPAVGGTISGSGASIRFPAGVFPAAFRINIAALPEESGSQLPDASRRVSRVYDITKSASGMFLKPVTITLPFDSVRLDPKADTVAVYWLNEVTGEWVPLNNASIDRERGTVSGETIHFTKFAVLTAPGQLPSGDPLPALGDISGHWAEASILSMVGQGYVKGYPDGTFRPNAKVTRAEFVQLIVRAFGIAEADASAGAFRDAADHWARGAIAAARAAGIVDGYENGTFRPNEAITREQMAVMMARALKLRPAAAGGKGTVFADRADISAWAKASVLAAAENGLFVGDQAGAFRPHAYATRAETVEALRRAVDLRQS